MPHFTIPAARRRLRRYAFDAFRRLTPFIGVTGTSGRFIVATDDLGIGRKVYAGHGYGEDKMVEAIDVLRGEGFNLTGSTILDVGANIGVTTVPALTRLGFGASLALEPDPQNYALLQANIALNGLADRVRALNVAATNQPGTLTLELSGDNHGDHRIRLTSAPGELREESWSTVAVAAVRLDTIDTGELPPIGLIWTDTQGHDAHVLDGLGHTLSDVPAVIEFWPYGLRRADGLELFYRVLADRYTRVYDLGRHEWCGAADLAAREALYPHREFTDLVAIP